MSSNFKERFLLYCKGEFENSPGGMAFHKTSSLKRKVMIFCFGFMLLFFMILTFEYSFSLGIIFSKNGGGSKPFGVYLFLVGIILSIPGMMIYFLNLLKFNKLKEKNEVDLNAGNDHLYLRDKTIIKNILIANFIWGGLSLLAGVFRFVEDGLSCNFWECIQKNFF